MIGYSRILTGKNKKYCCEDISLIENYNEAINDSKNKWELHHRLEIQNGKLVYTKKDLIDLNLYWNRPANELIFLTRKEHKALHQSIHNNFSGRGKSSWCKGKHFSEEYKRKISEGHKLYWANKKAKQSSNQIPENKRIEPLFQ